MNIQQGETVRTGRTGRDRQKPASQIWAKYRLNLRLFSRPPVAAAAEELATAPHLAVSVEGVEADHVVERRCRKTLFLILFVVGAGADPPLCFGVRGIPLSIIIHPSAA